MRTFELNAYRQPDGSYDFRPLETDINAHKGTLQIRVLDGVRPHSLVCRESDGRWIVEALRSEQPTLRDALLAAIADLKGRLISRKIRRP